MLTIKAILENHSEIIESLKVKNFDASNLILEIIQLDKQRRLIKTELESTQADINKISKQIGLLFKEGKQDEANQAKEKTGHLKELIKSNTAKQSEVDNKIHNILTQIPNIPHSSVPKGKSEADNEIVKSSIDNTPENKAKLPHWELAKKYNLIDFELGNKITGAGFPVYTGKGAKLQRALISFFLDEAEAAGYNEVLPPIIINEASGFGTGQLPDKEGQMYHIGEDNFYLIPTAEVPVTNIYRDNLLSPDKLPIKHTAYTPCFRREAGSYGKDVRGLNRLHQFDKVEIVHIVHPEKSYEVLDEMVNYVESLIQKLELPYKILRLCGGDLSFTSALTYDFEVYSEGQDKWLEVSSVSNFESYQANRLKLRFKEEGEKKSQLLHTLNGSALALPRIVAALLENNQTENNIKIPAVLHKYTGFTTIDY